MRRLSGMAVHVPIAAVVLAAGIGIGAFLGRSDAGSDSPPFSAAASPASSLSATTSYVGQGTFAFVDIGATGSPVPLTAEECQRATSMIRVTGENFAKFIANQPGGDVARAEFEGEQASSEAWAAAGCPPDPVRGKYPNADGSGAQMRLYAKSSFNGGPSTSWTGTGP